MAKKRQQRLDPRDPLNIKFPLYVWIDDIDDSKPILLASSDPRELLDFGVSQCLIVEGGYAKYGKVDVIIKEDY